LNEYTQLSAQLGVYSSRYHQWRKQEQVESYAKRKAISIEQAERLLSPNLD